MPVGAVLATAEAYELMNRDPVLHASTFAGNPLAMAAVQAAIRTIANEGLVARAETLGTTLLQELQRILHTTCPKLVDEVRGVGLLIGIEFTAPHLAGDFMYQLLQRQVIVAHSLNANQVVRLTPPAILTEAECTWLFEAVAEAARELHEAWS